MFIRNCPKCNIVIYYREQLTYQRGLQNNKLCRSCSHKRKSKRIQFIRQCPECKKDIIYAHQIVNGQLTCGNYYTAKKRNSLCKSCCQTGIRHSSFGKIMPPHVRELHRLAVAGKNNPNYGGFSQEHCNNLSTSLRNSDKIKELAARKKNIPRSSDVKRKIRLGVIQDFQKKHNCNAPNYNPKACQLFEEINKEMGWSGQHAENGGEFYIKELGYWVDYYEPNLNIVIEYDENRHRRQIDRDIQRQQEIEQYLDCKFYRIKEWESSSWQTILEYAV